MGKKNEHHSDEREFSILKGAIENTNEAFVTINQDHTVIFFNKTAEKIFGYKREEVLGRDLDVIMSPRCSTNHKGAVARYIATRTPRLIGHETEFMAARKNGEFFPAAISFSVTEVAGTLYFTAIIRDVSETKELQKKVAESERLAALGQLVAEITHEIKNPLMLIGGFSRQLKNSIEEAANLHKLEIITDEVERLEKLLSELVDVYRPRSQLHFEEMDVNGELKEVSEISAGNSKVNKVNVRFLAEQDHATIRGDKEKLKQVFLNLAKNAIEAMEGGGDLTIRSVVENNKVVITFKDTGTGISPENMDKVFKPFFTTKAKGTGLGMPVSKRIIEEHPGGSFHVESEEGRGTTVSVTLPLLGSEKGKE